MFTKTENHLAALAPATSFFHPGQYLAEYHEVGLIPDSGLSEGIERAFSKYSHKWYFINLPPIMYLFIVKGQ